jgi:hypothetical protein
MEELKEYIQVCVWCVRARERQKDRVEKEKDES